MKIHIIKVCVIAGLLMALSFADVVPVIAKNVTIVGEINEEYQIVADGVVYEVASNELGDYLVRNHISAKVKVSGTVSEQEGIKIITVSSFELLAE
ncbi:MAG: hypothetical protein JSU83_08880 [Deltaproteobacteria bacterium]|nr:MAG: hypothetical protein JSU83_08880 [Deltaproteobacteria bacterium]